MYIKLLYMFGAKKESVQFRNCPALSTLSAISGVVPDNSARDIYRIIFRYALCAK